jgi:hypothetical protein
MEIVETIGVSLAVLVISGASALTLGHFFLRVIVRNLRSY